MGSEAKPRPQSDFGLFWARKSHTVATDFYKRPKKKQQYRQEVPERRSGVQKKEAKRRCGAFGLNLSIDEDERFAV